VLRPIQVGDPGTSGAPPTKPPTELSIVVGDQTAGVIQVKPEVGRVRQQVWIDMILERESLTQELRTDAIVTLVGHLVNDCGHRRLVVRPAAHDVMAIRCYEEAGFRRVGVMRQALRDALGDWCDALLMDWVTPHCEIAAFT
jgi:aminoglycoside 6'-N-acetyltransferase